MYCTKDPVIAKPKTNQSAPDKTMNSRYKPLRAVRHMQNYVTDFLELESRVEECSDQLMELDEQPSHQQKPPRLT